MYERGVIVIGEKIMLKRIGKKIVFEICMLRMDAKWYDRIHCWEMYPPSFYYRYTPAEQKAIRSRDIAELKVMLEEYEKRVGIV